MFIASINTLVLSAWLWILKAIEPITHIRMFFRIHTHTLYCGIESYRYSYVLWCAPKDILWLSVTINGHTWDIYRGSDSETLLIYTALGAMGLMCVLGCLVALMIIMH